LKIYEIEYVGTYRTTLVTEEALENFTDDADFLKAEPVKECGMCGKKTEKLEIVGSLARCSDCEEKYYDSMDRARYYMSFHDDNF
jgi:NADH pyrophosphatase NudC (nudix superfamily)